MKAGRSVFVIVVLAGFFLAGLAKILPFWLAYLIAAALIAVSVYLVLQDNQAKLEHIESSYHREILASDKDRILKTKQLEIVFQNIPTPLALMNLKGEIAMNNEPFRRFYVKSPPVVVDYLSDAIQMEVRNFMKDSYLKESSIIKNIHVIDRDYLTLAIPFQENKRYAGCLLIFQDVTFYMEGDRMQKRFIADASHELRTPLSAIKGMVEILNRPEFDDEATKSEFLRQIQEESSRMETIIQDLLSLSRISASKVILQTQRVSLYDVVENSFSSLKQEYQQKGVQFINETKDCGAITMDPQKMHTVFTNLLSNAISSTDEGYVKVSCSPIGKAIEIKVHDSGAGIPAADLPHIFDRFYRVEKHRSRSSGGSGLGLAIVKGIVEAHGGIVGVTSSEGVGTTFTLTIPAN
ncbi:MAG: HAMP domain-containing sensor histidine kinase [Erysipelotrichaceae bacterium]